MFINPKLDKVFSNYELLQSKELVIGKDGGLIPGTTRKDTKRLIRDEVENNVIVIVLDLPE